MYHLVQSSINSLLSSRTNSCRITWRASWWRQDEIFSTQISLVARDGSAYIEETVKACPECQQSQLSPLLLLCANGSGPLGHGHAYVHIDFTGPMDNLTFLVIIDAHSKWIELFKMNSTTATATIQVLRTVFARFGIPESIVSDNGPQFTLNEFTKFCYLNGIRHVRVPPM